MPEDQSPESDNETMMDHCALECMHAIEAKDKAAFRESFETLVADLIMKMQKPDDKEAA